MLKLKLRYFGHLMQRVDSLEKTLILGGIGGRRRRGQQKMRWLDGLDGHEFERTLGVGDGQGGLACCNSWGLKESNMTEWLNWTELNWTEWCWTHFPKLNHHLGDFFEKYHFAYVFLGCRLFFYHFKMYRHVCYSVFKLFIRYVHAYVLSPFQSYPTFCHAMDCSLPGFCVQGDSPGKNTGVGCHALLQGIFPRQGWTHVSCISCISGRFFTHWATWEALIRYT